MVYAQQNSAAQENINPILKEYEDFAYIVSHDLNAPLRHVKEFTKLLLEARTEPPNQEEQDYINYIEKSLDKLNTMQDTLLEFSRLGTRAHEFQKADLNDLLHAAISALGDEIKEHDTQITYDTMPELTIEPVQIQLVFYHLISNALKFHAPDAPLRKIHIGAYEGKTDWSFTVMDNGIGIHEKNYSEIFKLFRRLQPDAYAGNGAGLTFAQKIVRQHQGEMRIRSQEGEGTTILFSIAKDL